MAINPSDWGRRVEITVSGTISSLTGYTALITDSNLPSEIWTRALNGGGDLRVCLNSDGTNQLPLEVVLFDTTTQDAILWTRFPSFATGSSVWLFYERSGETQPPVTDSFGRNAVWQDESHLFHMIESSGSTAINSTGGTAGTYGGTLPNRGADFGQDYTSTFPDDQLNIGLSGDVSSGWYFSIRIRISTLKLAQIYTADNVSDRLNQFRIESNGTVRLIIFDNSESIILNQAGSTVLSSGVDYIVGFRYDPSSGYSTFINGSVDLSSSVTTAPNTISQPDSILGDSALNVNDTFLGQMGDAKISRSASKFTNDYISTESLNQLDPATFWTAGAPEDTSGGATYTITLDTGSYTYTGQAVALLSNKSISLDLGNYTYTGQSVDLLADRSINLESGNYAYTGQDVALVYNPSGGPTYSLPIDAGAYNYSGQDVQLIANRTLSIDGGDYAYTGSNLSLRANRSISIDSGAYVVTGNAVTLSANRAITLDVGNYAYTGSPVTLSYSGEVIALISGYSVNYAQDAATATYTDDYIKARFI